MFDTFTVLDSIFNKLKIGLGGFNLTKVIINVIEAEGDKNGTKFHDSP